MTEKNVGSKCWICDNDYIDNNVKIKDNCHITGKYRDNAHKDCKINVKLNHKTPVVFHNLKTYDSHLIIQELDKFNLKINVIDHHGLKKHMSFSINNKLSFIDSFQLLSSSLDSLVKNLRNDCFKYLSNEFNNNVLDLVKQKNIRSSFILYERYFKKFKEELTSKEKFHSSLTGKKLVTKNIMLLRFATNLKLYLNFDILLLADVFQKSRNSNSKNYGLCPSLTTSI